MNRSCMVPCAIPSLHTLLTCMVLPGSEARRLRVARKCVPEKKPVPLCSRTTSGQFTGGVGLSGEG